MKGGLKGTYLFKYRGYQQGFPIQNLKMQQWRQIPSIWFDPLLVYQHKDMLEGIKYICLFKIANDEAIKGVIQLSLNFGIPDFYPDP